MKQKRPDRNLSDDFFDSPLPHGMEFHLILRCGRSIDEPMFFLDRRWGGFPSDQDRHGIGAGKNNQNE